MASPETEGLVLALGVALVAALTAYAVLGGADFGGGIWDLLARGPRRRQQQEAVARAMGPVWEANHVWLIFALVILFSGFPRAFAALGVALFLPVHLVLLGIILRGAAFVFRAHGAEAAQPWLPWAGLFGAASTITPFLLGVTLAAVSSGGIRIGLSPEAARGYLVAPAATVDPVQAWLSPFSLLTGALTLALCAYLAAVYLTLETRGPLQEDFRRRALGSGGAAALLAGLLLTLMARTAPWLWESFAQRRALPLLLAGGLLTLLSLGSLWSRRYALARAAAVAQVAVLLWGWALAQWPYLVYPDLTLAAAAAPAPTLRFMLLTLPVGLLLLVPSLWLLFRVFKGQNPAAGEKGE